MLQDTFWLWLTEFFWDALELHFSFPHCQRLSLEHTYILTSTQCILKWTRASKFKQGRIHIVEIYHTTVGNFRVLNVLHVFWGACMLALCILGLLDTWWRGEFLGADLLWVSVLFMTTGLMTSNNYRYEVATKMTNVYSQKLILVAYLKTETFSQLNYSAWWSQQNSSSPSSALEFQSKKCVPLPILSIKWLLTPHTETETTEHLWRRSYCIPFKLVWVFIL